MQTNLELLVVTSTGTSVFMGPVMHFAIWSSSVLWLVSSWLLILLPMPNQSVFQ